MEVINLGERRYYPVAKYIATRQLGVLLYFMRLIMRLSPPSLLEKTCYSLFKEKIQIKLYI